MTEEANRLIEQAITAARAERKEEAETLLNQAIAIDPSNERAWLWLSAVVEGVENQRQSLRRVLDINPDNNFARTGLSFLSHLRPGYEYLAARAPWIEGFEEGHAALSRMPSRICPRCGAKNPGWGYLCNRCGAVLEPGDVAKAIQQDIRGKSPVIIRPWGPAAALNAARTFAPEVALASPLRAIMIVVLGTVALNLLRVAGTMSIITLVAPHYFFRSLNRLMPAFLSDQLALSVGALAAWVLLSLVTYAITRALGGMGSERTHYYLVAVAISSCMPIAGIVGLIWWTVALLVPEAPVWLLSGLAGGLLFFYFLTLLVQGVHTTHGESKIQETVTTGGLLFFCTVLYVGLVAILPHGLQSALLEVTRVLLLPVWR